MLKPRFHAGFNNSLNPLVNLLKYAHRGTPSTEQHRLEPRVAFLIGYLGGLSYVRLGFEEDQDRDEWELLLGVRV